MIYAGSGADLGKVRYTMNAVVSESFFVLVADDSIEDRLLLKAAIRQSRRLRTICEVSDGDEVIAYFKGHAGFGDRAKFPIPDLLLLDLGMPVRDGFEVLEWLRAHPLPGDLTVVVLTASMESQDIKRALDLGADLFQVKPRSQRDRHAMVMALEELLLNSAQAAARRLTALPPIPTRAELAARAH